MAKAQAGTAGVATIAYAGEGEWIVIGANGQRMKHPEFATRQECKAWFVEHVAGEGSTAKAAAAEELAPLSPGE